MSQKRVEDFLKAFSSAYVASLLRHFAAAVVEFQQGNWESAIAKAGKFVEAVMKALWASTGNTVPSGRTFKVDSIINGLAQLSAASHHDSVRLAIPRACRFVYDIASNRGARHDPDEVDPNEMDATAVLVVCSWILAEMIRVSHRGKVDLTEAKALVDSLVEKKYPIVERVDERVYFHGGKKSALEVALLALGYAHPGTLSKPELIATVRRHGFKLGNARMAVNRVMEFVDDDGKGELRLLTPGLKKAEEIMKRLRDNDRN